MKKALIITTIFFLAAQVSVSAQSKVPVTPKPTTPARLIKQGQGDVILSGAQNNAQNGKSSGGQGKVSTNEFSVDPGQNEPTPLKTRATYAKPGTISLGMVAMKEGENTLTVPRSGATLQLKIANTSVSTMSYVDPNGKSVDLQPQGSALLGGATATVFMSADKTIEVKIQKTATTGYYQTYLKRSAGE